MHNDFKPYLDEVRTRLQFELPADRVEDTICELAAHLELDYEDLRGHGLAHEEALARVQERFGSARPIASQLAESDQLRLGNLPMAKATLLCCVASLVISAMISLYPVFGYMGLGFPVALMTVGAFLVHMLSGIFMATSFLGRRIVPSVVWSILTIQLALGFTLAVANQWPRAGTSLVVTGLFPYTALWSAAYMIAGHVMMALLGRGLLRNKSRAVHG